MTQTHEPHPDYESLHWISNAIAQWIAKYRYARGIRNELMNCSADDVAGIARELKITPVELATLAKKGPNAADLLQRLLIALGVDANGLENDDPLVMRDLQRLCITCGHKRQCELDLAKGELADTFLEYCPNAFTLDALLKAKQ
jgi:pyrroloquinoline quinone (PQQ) biosynthesis protein C